LCDEVASETGKSIAVAVQAADIKAVADAVSIPVLAQHIDAVGFGSNTGHILPEAVKEAGAVGTLLNHSEHQLHIKMIAGGIDRARQVGLKTIVCANTADKAAEVAELDPDMVAVEPPELIGGDISVSTAKPEIIKNTVEKVEQVADIPVLCGAGVKTGDDIKKSIELGAKGVLLASGITKAEEPKKVLLDMAKSLE